MVWRFHLRRSRRSHSCPSSFIFFAAMMAFPFEWESRDYFCQRFGISTFEDLWETIRALAASASLLRCWLPSPKGSLGIILNNGSEVPPSKIQGSHSGPRIFSFIAAKLASPFEGVSRDYSQQLLRGSTFKDAWEIIRTLAASASLLRCWLLLSNGYQRITLNNGSEVPHSKIQGKPFGP